MEEETNDRNKEEKIEGVKFAKMGSDEARKQVWLLKEEAIESIRGANSFLLFSVRKTEGTVEVIAQVPSSMSGPSEEARFLIEAFADWKEKYEKAVKDLKNQGGDKKWEGGN